MLSETGSDMQSVGGQKNGDRDPIKNYAVYCNVYYGKEALLQSFRNSGWFRVAA